MLIEQSCASLHRFGARYDKFGRALLFTAPVLRSWLRNWSKQTRFA